jgi:hypothetical protein
MYNIYMEAWGEADYLMGTVATENDAKDVVAFYNALDKEVENSNPIYYREMVLDSVKSMTNSLDRDYGVRDDAWGIRHDVVWNENRKTRSS